MFPSSPGYATDAQLSQMARGGLPNAVNEEITRLALRRGARAVPQPQTPRAPMPMSGEEMIKDFVNRVRQENTNAANSIVPAGTPMQQPQQPPQPQPAQASGIAGFQTGGAYVPRLSRDQDYDWLPGGDKPLSRADQQIPPDVKPVRPFPSDSPTRGMDLMRGSESFSFSPSGPVHSAYELSLQQKALADKAAALNARFKSPDGMADKLDSRFAEPDFFFDERAQPPVPVGGSGSAGIAALMAEVPRVGAFKPSEYVAPAPYEDAKLIDMNEAGDERVKKNRDKIDALAAPYNEGAAELEGMSEEIKRKEIFNGMVQAGIAMMQGGGASFDPRSGDMMAVMGDGAAAYVDSLTKDRKRQQELKEKIVAYKGAANELTFNAEGQMFAQGADIAQAQNQQAITEGAYRNQYNSRSAEMQNNFNLGVDGLRMQERGQNLQADIAKFEAGLKVKLSQQSGLDPEIAEKIANNAGQHYQSAYNTYLSQAGFSEVSDAQQKERILQDAQAQGIAASSAYLDRINRGILGGTLGDVEAITRTEQGRYRGAASVVKDREGVTSLERPYSPKIDDETMSVQSYLDRFSNGS